MKQYIDLLEKEHCLTKEIWMELLEKKQDAEYLFERARKVRRKYYQNKVFTRGLIEYSNYCKNDCKYCGIRRSNCNANRYRLSEDDILSCCEQGYKLGFRTFVLQGGEDGYFTADRLEHIIRKIKVRYPDCALTLSAGEWEKEDYLRFYQAGADRYLLRQETSSEEHYQYLHPKEMSFAHRRQCLYDLKEIGYQVGCGFMVGSPGQTVESLADDFLFITKLCPQMVGIGPFVPHHDTPFAECEGGTVEDTLYCLGLLRLLKPNLLLPSTTALGTIDPRGREKGILAGANVVMPNLSPISVRKKYELYDNKICTQDEAAECRECLNRRMKSIGYQLVIDRGDPVTQINE